MAKPPATSPRDSATCCRAQHEVAELTLRLWAAALTASPEPTEKLYVGWHNVGLHHSDKGYVAALFPRAHEVHIRFEHGRRPGRPARPAAGRGRQVRYLVFSPEAARRTLDDLVEDPDLALGK